MNRDFVFSYVNGHPGRAAVWYREQFVLVGEIRGMLLTPTLAKELIAEALQRVESVVVHRLSWKNERLLLRGLKVNKAFNSVEPFFEYLHHTTTSPRLVAKDIEPLFATAMGTSWAFFDLHRREVSFVSDRFDPYKEEYYHPVRAWLGWEERREEE